MIENSIKVFNVIKIWTNENIPLWVLLRHKEGCKNHVSVICNLIDQQSLLCHVIGYQIFLISLMFTMLHSYELCVCPIIITGILILYIIAPFRRGIQCEFVEIDYCNEHIYSNSSTNLCIKSIFPYVEHIN